MSMTAPRPAVCDALHSCEGRRRGAHAIEAELTSSLARRLGTNYAIRYPLMPNEAVPEYLD